MLPHLPSELIAHIIKLSLPAFDSHSFRERYNPLLRLQLVNKQWCSLAQRELFRYVRVRVETQTLGTWRARKSTEELLLENVAQSDLDRLLSTTESVHFDGNEQKEDPVPDLIWRKCSSLKSFRGSFGVILAEDFAHLPGLSSMTLTDFRLGGEQQTQALNMTLCCTNLASLTLVDCDHYGALGTDATLLFNPTSLPSLSELVLIPATHESDRLASGTWKEAIKLLAPQLESFAFGSGAAELGQQNINWKLFGRLRRLFLNARADDLAAAISSIDMLSSDSLETLHVVIDAWDNNGAMPLLKMLIDKLSSTRPHLSTFRNLYIANTSLGNFYDDVEPEQAAAWRSLQVSTKQQDITLTTSSKFQISDPHLDSMEWTVYDDPWAQQELWLEYPNAEEAEAPEVDSATDGSDDVSE